MTREEAKQAAEVMKAYAEGKDIEYLTLNDEWKLCRGDKKDAYMELNFHKYKYRIKKEPTYRPFKDKDECWAEMQKRQPFGWVYEKLSTAYINIHSIDSGDDYNIIFKEFTFADGTPFGIKEERK